MIKRPLKMLSVHGEKLRVPTARAGGGSIDSLAATGLAAGKTVPKCCPLTLRTEGFLGAPRYL